jgi:hypothetical protein
MMDPELQDLQLSATEPGREKRQIFRTTPQTMRPQAPGPGLVDQMRATWVDNYGYAGLQLLEDTLENKPIYDELAQSGYDPTTFITRQETEEYGDVLLQARSPQELEFIRSRIAEEQQARQTLADGPWNPVVVGLLGAFGDPTSYIPVAGQLTKVAQGAKLATRLAILGGTSAVDIALGEALAQSTQYTRTGSETAMAIILGGTVSMGLGGLGVAVSRGLKDSAGEWGKAVDLMAAEVGATQEGGSIGAAISDQQFVARAEDSAPVAAGFARGVSKVFGVAQMAPPALQLAVSKVGAIRGLAHRLVDTGVMTQGELHGLSNAPGGSLDMAIRQRNESTWKTSTFLLQSHKAARASGYTGNLAEFKREVHNVLAGGDASNPAVEAAAQKIDENVLVPYERELREARDAAGLKEDPAFGASTERSQRWARAQKYNPRKISQDLAGFQKALKEALRKNADKHNQKLDDEIAELKKKVVEEKAKQDAKAAARKAGGRPMKIRRTTSERKIETLEGKKLGQELLDDMASDLELQMLGYEPSGGTTALKVKMKGDSGVETRGVFLDPKIMANYLADDAEELVHGFVRQVAPEIEALNKFGSLDLEKTQMFQQAKAQASQAADAAKTPKEREAIIKQSKRELDMLRKVWNRVIGKQEPAKAQDFLRATQATLRGVSFMNKLGSVVISSLADPGRIVMTEGFLRTMKHLGGDVFGLMGSFKLTRDIAKSAGTALNMASNTVGSRRWDLGDQFSPRTRTEMMVNKASSIFSTATGLPVWTDYWQTFHIQIAQTRILETAKKFADAGGDMAALSTFERLKIAQDNFTPAELMAIAGEAPNWVSRGGGIQPQLAAWKSREARGAFLRAVHREGETGVYNPGVGDKPLWTTDPSLGGLGKTVSQFKAYSMAATTRMLVATAQNVGAGMYGRVVASTAFLISAGMFAEAVHDLTKSGEVKKRNPLTWANVGLDRSGLMGSFYELDGLAESMNLPSFSTAVTGEPLPRFRSRGPFSQALGPAFGQIEDIAKVTYGLTRSGLNETSVHGIRKLIPFQNHAILAHGFNAVEEALVDGFQLPRSRK